MNLFGKNISFPLLSTRHGKIMTAMLASIFVITVALDQISKRHAHDVLMTWENAEDIQQYRSSSYPIGSIGEINSDPSQPSYFGRLKFQYQRNTGAAFSMFANVDDRIRVPFFYAVTFFAVLFIAYYLKTLPLNFHLTRFGLVMILSGAIGNFIDRVLLGYVIDFIDVDWIIHNWRHDFAVFNVADIAINIGIIAFVAESFLPIKPVLPENVEEEKQPGANKGQQAAQ